MNIKNTIILSTHPNVLLHSSSTALHNCKCNINIHDNCLDTIILLSHLDDTSVSNVRKQMFSLIIMFFYANEENSLCLLSAKCIIVR